MDLTIASILLNIIVMILLSVMIYQSRRLAKSISIFKNSRQDMQQMIKELSAHIDKADQAIKTMRKETDVNADDLQTMITKGRALSDELQFIQEAGDRLANRLEKLADQNSAHSRRSYEEYENSNSDQVKAKSKTETSRRTASSPPAFDIVDREYDPQNIASEDKLPSFLTKPEEDDMNVPKQLQSKAERELAEALEKKRSGKKGS